MKRSAAGGARPAKKPKVEAPPPTPAEDEAALGEDVGVYKRFFFPKFAAELADKGLRPDGRKAADFLGSAVSVGALDKALGSAVVAMGSTKVLCGVRGGFIPPVGPKTNRGRVEVQCTVAETAEPGIAEDPMRYTQFGNSVASFVDSMLKATNAVDVEKLCVQPELCAWNLHVDLYVLNNGGSLKVACLHAAAAALLNTRLPQMEVHDGQPREVDGAAPKELGITKYPLGTTFCEYKGRMLADITEEEEALGSEVTVIHDSTARLVNVYKQGGAPLGEEVLKESISAAKARAKTLKQVIETSTASRGKQAGKKKGLF
eukprot:TRINITY_DN7339_c0_g1_i1.p1 TRINITY_DN7339_c0_g1~~TRINITY_DN7339_c0_g1_i1.p1  ORF type:complete len:317 (+),score=139.06 TRINITY_DN7339_c0_g1_i1:148-1098(+)